MGLTVVFSWFFQFWLWPIIYNFFAPRTLSKNFGVSREGYYLSEYLFNIGKNYLLPPPPIGQKIAKKPIFFTSNANKMTLNQLFSTFYLIFRFFTYWNRWMSKKIEKLTFQVGFFLRRKKKRVILWARVIFWALEEYTKFKFLHFSSKYLEKSSL